MSPTSSHCSHARHCCNCAVMDVFGVTARQNDHSRSLLRDSTAFSPTLPSPSTGLYSSRGRCPGPVPLWASLAYQPPLTQEPCCGHSSLGPRHLVLALWHSWSVPVSFNMKSQSEGHSRSALCPSELAGLRPGVGEEHAPEGKADRLLSASCYWPSCCRTPFLELCVTESQTTGGQGWWFPTVAKSTSTEPQGSPVPALCPPWAAAGMWPKRCTSGSRCASCSWDPALPTQGEGPVHTVWLFSSSWGKSPELW